MPTLTHVDVWLPCSLHSCTPAHTTYTHTTHREMKRETETVTERLENRLDCFETGKHCHQKLKRPLGAEGQLRNAELLEELACQTG